jgi:hypothetical protein
MTADTAPSPSKKRKSQGRGRSNSLPGHVVEYLKNWLMSPEHINHPYPSEAEKAKMVEDTGIDMKRLNNWFVNNRIRFWKPRYEAMQKQLLQQNKKLDNSKEGSTTSVASPVSPPKETTSPKPSSTDDVQQEVTSSLQVAIPAPRLSEPRLDLSHLMFSTAINDFSATVSDDESYSSRESSSADATSKHDSLTKTNGHLKKTDKFRRCRKRQRCDSEDDCFHPPASVELSLRFKYAGNDAEQWKLACSGARSTCNSLYDTDLPSLDEAVCLFGYSVVSSN